MIPLTKIILGVEYPLYVLRRVSDKFVINPRAISNTTGLPNPGPDQEYLPILTDIPPDHDGRFTIRTQTEAPNETTTPPQWEIHYVISPRTKDEKKEAARNTKRLKVQDHVPVKDYQELIVLLLMVVLRDANGLSLTAKETALKNKLVVMAQKLRENDDRLNDIEAAIDADQTPDLDAGWAAP